MESRNTDETLESSCKNMERCNLSPRPILLVILLSLNFTVCSSGGKQFFLLTEIIAYRLLLSNNKFYIDST